MLNAQYNSYFDYPTQAVKTALKNFADSQKYFV